MTTNATAILPARRPKRASSPERDPDDDGLAYPATVAIPGVSSVVLTATDPTEGVTVTNGIAGADVGPALAAMTGRI